MNSQVPENIIDSGGGHCDALVTGDDAVRLKTGEYKRVDKLFQRHTVLESERNGNRKAVHETTVGGAFLVHVDEYFAQRSVIVLTGAEINFVSRDHRFLGITGSTMRKSFPFSFTYDLNNFLSNFKGLLLVDILNIQHFEIFADNTVERLTQFRTVSINRRAFEHEFPAQHVGFVHLFKG